MVEKSDVAAVLELIRPSLQADGGDVQLVDVSDDGVVTVELQGAHPEGARARRYLRGAGPIGGNEFGNACGLFGARFFTREAGVWKDAGAVAGAMTRCRGAVRTTCRGSRARRTAITRRATVRLMWCARTSECS